MQSIYSPKLKGLLYKRVDKDKMNGIGRLYIQLRYPWLNSFLSKNMWNTVHEFTKLERLTDIKKNRLDKDEMNGIERPHMQLSYSWLHSLFFLEKISKVQWMRTMLKFP